MNSHEKNLYEFYRLATNWELTPNGPTQLTKHTTVDSAITVVKCIFGEGDSGLMLPPLFGTEYPDTIDAFFQREKLGPQHLLELGIQPKYNMPAAVDSGNEASEADH